MNASRIILAIVGVFFLAAAFAYAPPWMAAVFTVILIYEASKWWREGRPARLEAAKTAFPGRDDALFWSDDLEVIVGSDGEGFAMATLHSTLDRFIAEPALEASLAFADPQEPESIRSIPLVTGLMGGVRENGEARVPVFGKLREPDEVDDLPDLRAAMQAEIGLIEVIRAAEAIVGVCTLELRAFHDDQVFSHLYRLDGAGFAASPERPFPRRITA